MTVSTEIGYRILATALEGQEQLSAARSEAQSALAQRCENGRLWEAAALLDHSDGQFESCQRKLEMAMLYVPLRPAAWCCMADCYLQAGSVDEALEICIYIVNTPNVPVELLRYCAAHLDTFDKASIAVEAARRVVGIHRDNAQYIFEFGYYLARSGSPTRLVLSVVKQAVALAPNKAIYRFALAKLLIDLGNNEAGLTWVRHLSAAQLDQFTCECCLERLASIFESGDDWVRAHACRVRIQNLPSTPQIDESARQSLFIREYLTVNPAEPGTSEPIPVAS